MLSLISIILYGSSPLIRETHEAYTYLLLTGQHLDPPAHNFPPVSTFCKVTLSSYQE